MSASITLTTSPCTLSLLIGCKLYSLHRYNTREHEDHLFLLPWHLASAGCLPGKEGIWGLIEYAIWRQAVLTFLGFEQIANLQTMELATLTCAFRPLALFPFPGPNMGVTESNILEEDHEKRGRYFQTHSRNLHMWGFMLYPKWALYYDDSLMWI